MTNHSFNTVSPCVICCKTIPAAIEFDKQVVLTKTCSEHGTTEVVLELDPVFYSMLRMSQAQIYPGHFIDVTTRCNIDCPYCYFPCRDTEDRSIENIMQEALCQPVVTYLTGGEPTMRQDLPELIERLESHYGAAMPTNGLGLLNHDYLVEVMKHIGRYDGNVARIALSWHDDLNAKTFRRVLENVRELDETIAGPSFVMRSLDELPKFLEIADEFEDCIDTTRIHVSTDLWDAEDTSQIFMSDIIKYLTEYAKSSGEEFEWYPDQSLLMWTLARFGKLQLSFVRWNTVYDIDLCCVPFHPSYTAHNGEVTNLTYGWMINEAMQRGWIKGSRMKSFDKEVVHG